MWSEYRAVLTAPQLDAFLPDRNQPGVRSSERLRKLAAALPIPGTDAKLGDVLFAQSGQFGMFSAFALRGTKNGFALSAIGSPAAEVINQHGAVLFGHVMREVGGAFAIRPASGECGLQIAPMRRFVINELVLEPRGPLRVHAHDVHEKRAQWLDERGHALLAKALSRSVFDQLAWLSQCGDDVEGPIAREALQAFGAPEPKDHRAARDRAAEAITARLRWRITDIGHVTLVPCHGGWKLRLSRVRVSAAASFTGLWLLGSMKVEGRGAIREEVVGTQVSAEDVARALAAAGLSIHHVLA